MQAKIALQLIFLGFALQKLHTKMMTKQYIDKNY